MSSGLLVVQSRPASPDVAEAYHRWYDEVHIPELLQVDGFARASRYEAADGESFLAVYELDDVDLAQSSMATAREAGSISPPVGVQTDPPPSVQWFRSR
jgi:hypothetical protein